MDIKTVIITIALAISTYLIGFNRGEHKGFVDGIMAQVKGGIKFELDNSSKEDEHDN